LKHSLTLRYGVLSGLVLLAMLAYSVYWSTLAGRIEAGLAAWAQAQRSDGMLIEYDALEVTGFPLRVQPQISNLRLAAPGPNPAWQWRSDQLIANVTPYNSNHIVLTAPYPQDIGLRINGGALEQYRLAPGKAQASLALKQGRITRIDLDIEGGALSGGRLLSHALGLGRVQLHLREGQKSEANGLQNPTLFEISAKLEKLEYPGFANSALGANLSLFAMTAAVEGFWPEAPGLAGVTQWRDAGGVVQIKAAQIDWGSLKLEAAGTLALDAQNRAIGSLTAKLMQHAQLIKGLQEAGQLTREEASAAGTGLNIIAMVAGETADGKTGALTLPMVLQNGEMFIGPLRIAKLKPLY